MKSRSLLHSVFAILISLASIVQLNAQTTSCGTATTLPVGGFMIPPNNAVTYYVKYPIYAAVPFTFRVNSGANTAIEYSASMTCPVGGFTTSTTNTNITTNVPTSLTFDNAGCPEIKIGIRNPGTDTITISGVVLGAGVLTQPVCPLPGNISIELLGETRPYAMCDNATIKNIKVRATDGSGNAICLEEGTVSGPGVTDGTNNTGTFDPTMTIPGVTTITWDYNCPSGGSTSANVNVQIYPTPIASLRDIEQSCADEAGTVFLPIMNDGGTTTGDWTLVSGPAGGMINDDDLEYTQPGCYQIRFTATDLNNCNVPPSSDVAFIRITAQPEFEISLSSQGGCLASGSTSVSATINPSFPGSWTVNGNPATLPFNVNAPDSFQTDSYTFCYTVEQITTSTCGGITTPDTCTEIKCKTISFYNDGLNCQSNCEFERFTPCDINVLPRIRFGCSGFFNISLPFDLLGAEITPEQQLVTCEQDSVTFSFNGLFVGFDPSAGGAGDTKIEDIDGLDVVCRVLNFCICIDAGLFEIEIRPFDALYQLLGCNKTVAQFIIDALGAFITDQDADSGQYVIADTNGDGAFDYVVYEGLFPWSNNGNPVSIPNHVNGQGEITIRNVVGWPSAPIDACGNVTASGKDLLELLPIGAIPIVGGPIEDFLETLGCGANLVWTNEKTVRYPVINNSFPEFVNCPIGGYTYSEDFACTTTANWSIPQAIDGCTGETLIFDPNPGTTPGIRHVSGPMPGDDLAVGTYTVVYEATACNGLSTQCTFDVVVTTGNPELEAPADVIVGTDVDQCTAVVLGLTPLKGIGCSTTITYSSTGATLLSGTGDISGNTFNLGVTTVTYTMSYDDDGDPGTPPITATDMFTVTVEDDQNPVADCREISLTLDNTGSGVVLATDINGASSDNCTTAGNLDIAISKDGQVFSTSLNYDCDELGINQVVLRVIDEAGNESYCLSSVDVLDFFDGYQLTLDAPELCLEANNPVQLDFSNYLDITRPNGQEIQHSQVEAILGGNVGGFFGITSFLPSTSNTGTELGTGPNDPRDIGYIDPLTGMYTPGSGSGYVTISYLLAIGGQVAQNNIAITGCFLIVHETFELRPALQMGMPSCECLDQEARRVDLGIITGGLEPYRITYTGATLDTDMDGLPDDTDGIFTYDEMAGYDITDDTEDLGQLLVDFTIPVWSISIIDARGCEIARSGSCDVDDLTEAPVVECQPNVDSLFTETFECHNQYTWIHPLPFDNCKVIIYDYQITNPDGTIEGPFDLVNLLNISPGAPLDERFEAEYEFEKGTSIVQYYVEDAVGLFDTCSFTVTVYDDDPPIWQNCPRLPIVENAETGHCDAYVNFSAPYAIDNCSDTVFYRQIDETGLNSGSRFPVGTTILIFEASDECGNADTCEYKVIVNDFWETPIVMCPDSVDQINDLDECGAIVNSLAPRILDSCASAIAVTYIIEDENGDTIKVGSGDASGEFFPVGSNNLIYNVQDQPFMMITEVTQQLMTDPQAKLIGGTDPKPAFLDQTDVFGDYVEITNFGPAAMDVSCLQLSICVDTGVLCTYVVPNLTVIPVGEVLTLRVGAGMDDTTNLFFNMGCEEAAIDEPRGYVISLYDRVLDVVTTNGFDPVGCGDIAIVTADDWSGDSQEHFCSGSFYRKDIIDHNDPRDWLRAESCSEATIGSLNPNLAEYVNIWNGDTVSLQSVAPGIASCSTNVNIRDVELPTCIEHDTVVYSPGTNLGVTIECGDCYESVINVSSDLLIGDINVLNLQGTAENINALDVVLISPAGKEVTLFDGACADGDTDFDVNFDDDGFAYAAIPCNPLGGGGLYQPQGELKDYYQDEMMGDWTLQISNNSCEDEVAVLTNWELQIMGILPYSQMDTTLANDPGECSAEFCWIHPILEDNCCEGTIDVEYIAIAPPTLRVPTGGRIVQGTSVCETFDVGRTLVRYTLTDQYGNTNQCSFEVDVDDVEDPVITNCPGDRFEQLTCGLCGIYYRFPYEAEDNCFVDTIIVIPPNGSYLPIGDTTICVIALDTSGNADTCKYVLSVLEYQPLSNELACVDDINLSLDATCTAVLTADMVLEGCNHRCYENYELTITKGCGPGQPGPIHSDTFTIADVGECFQVTVTDPNTGNSCWGCVCIEEKLLPELQCPPDDTISCIESLDPSLRGFATQLTCDPAASITYRDSLVDNGDCEDFRAILYRIWTIEDVQGNKARCTQTISVRQFDLADVTFPRNYDNLDLPALECDEFKTDKDVSGHIIDAPFCVDGYLLDSAVWRATGGDPSLGDLSGDRVPKLLGWNTIDSGPFEGYPSPFPIFYDEHPQWRLIGACWGPEDRVQWLGTGVPTIAGSSIYEDGAYCDLSIRYDDELYDICDDGYEILRYWKVRDMCRPPVFGINPMVHIQVIKVLDKQGPEINYPDAVTIGTDVWSCYSRWDVPEPWLEDNCSNDLSYRVIVRDGRALETSPGGPWLVEGLEPGVHRVTIEASDGCGNTTEHDVMVTVVDDTPPVAICKDRLQLSLVGSQSPGSNFSAICAEDLDKASYDNCTDWLWYKMIRQDELLGTVNGSFAPNDAACGGVNGDDDALIAGNQVYFDDCSKFCCEDADEVVMVVLRVHDVDPGAGPVNPLRYTPPAGDLVGHFTDCWVEIEVVDKAQPIVVAPPDMVVSCMFWFDDSEDALEDITNPTFGRVVTDLNSREKVKTIDVVCEEWCIDHPKYDYEPSRDRPAIWRQACDFYDQLFDPAHPDDKYELVWGFDGYAINTCGATPTIRVDDRRECGQGVINRDVIVTYQDAKTGGVVTYRDRQEIWVIDCDPFFVSEDCFNDEDCIDWPLFCQQPDPLDGCGADLDPYTNADLGFPVVQNGCDDNCAMIVVEYEDEILTVEPDACFKVIRTWVVIDWCQYDPLAPRDDDGDNPNQVSVGRWEYIQVINVRDKVDPVLTVDIGDCEPAEKDSTGVCFGRLEMCAIATDDCSQDDWIVYDYKIDAFSDGVGQFGDFDFYVGKLTVEQFNNGTRLVQGPLDCSAYNQGGYCNPYAEDPTQPFCATGTYPVGIHTIYWFAEDGCGNVTKVEEVFEIKDCKEPTPYCKTGIVTVVMPSTGEICVWANDLDDGSFDNCTDTADLKFYFNGDPTMTEYCINCDTFEARGANEVVRIEVEVWVEDEEGNSDFCVTTIEVQDNQDVCENTGTIAQISGEIATYYGDYVQDAEAGLTMNDAFMTMMSTASDGQYVFKDLNMYNDYEVKPELDKEHLNGVSTKDLVLIQRHLLGITEFDSPYLLIAADVNNSESVSVADISSLRKVILGLKADFSDWDNVSWRFVPKDFQFADPNSPWPFNESNVYTELDRNHYGKDFVGVKVGDVSGDVVANQFSDNTTRTVNTLTLAEDYSTSESVVVYRLALTEDMALSGFQMTLEYDPEVMQFNDVVDAESGLNASHLGLTEVEDGRILVSWNAPEGEYPFLKGESILALKFTKLKLLEEVNVDVRSTGLLAEAYDDVMETYNIEVRPMGEDGGRFALHQNRPNPFSDQTKIGFELPEDMPIVMTFYDGYGKIVLIVEMDAKGGYNEVLVGKEKFGAEGVYYYQLDAASHTATKRMVLQ